MGKRRGPCGVHGDGRHYRHHGSCGHLPRSRLPKPGAREPGGLPPLKAGLTEYPGLASACSSFLLFLTSLSRLLGFEPSPASLMRMRFQGELETGEHQENVHDPKKIVAWILRLVLSSMRRDSVVCRGCMSAHVPTATFRYTSAVTAPSLDDLSDTPGCLLLTAAF